MQIVIDIPEEIFNYIKMFGAINIMHEQTIANAIDKSTILPERHGRLIDADALMKDYGNPDVKILLDNMDTIIEANKAESELQKSED